MIVNALWVGVGGFLGAICRYLGNYGVAKISLWAHFPLGTLMVNLVGCFAIGLLAYWGDARDIFSHNMRLFVFVGFLGAFTTFSSFGHETVNLMRGHMPWAAFLNVILHVVLGLFFVWLGLSVGRLLLKQL